jgi:hypothetical protein
MPTNVRMAAMKKCASGEARGLSFMAGLRW